MSTFKHLHVSLEGIEFQNGAFFKELVLVLGQHPMKQRRSLNNADFGKLGESIDKCVKKHAGVSVNSVFEDFDLNGYVSMPIVDLNNPLFADMNSWFPVGAEGVGWFVEKENSNFKINNKTGMITGAFTKMVFKMGLAKLTYINGKLNDEQMAAIILHEIGHLFSFFDFFDKTVTSNAVLNELDKQLRTSPGPKEREVIIEKAGKALGFERTIAQDAAKSSDDKVVLTVFIGNAIEAIRSETGNSFFDASTWETLADQYAVRQGAGSALATALDIMYAGDYAASVGGSAKYFITETLKIIRLIFVVGSGSVSLVSGIVTGNIGLMALGAFCLAMSLAWLDGHQSGESTPTYATAYTRMQRVRQQMILYAKKLSTEIRPSNVQAQLLQDVALVDECLKNFHDRQSWLDTVAGFVFSSVRTRQQNSKFQKELESIALNDLYLQGLSLKNLA